MCAPLLNFDCDCDAATAVLCAYKKGLIHLKGSAKKGERADSREERGRGIEGRRLLNYFATLSAHLRESQMKPQQQRQSQQNRHNYRGNNSKHNKKYNNKKYSNNKSKQSRQVGWPIKRSRLNLEAGQVYVAQWA